MGNGPRNTLVHHLRRAALLCDGAGLSDGELLEGFVARQDEAFFEVLVRRHGPMVLGVCRRILRNPDDAEDAFQATFLVLVRRAASIVPRELVGHWLYGVAYRTALEARRAAARRRARERQINPLPHAFIQPEELWQELRPLLDKELNRLPAKYRAAVVLCHLEGRTRQEAARQLGLPVGTLSGRVTTALRLLAKRLRRHGLAVSGGTLAAALSPQAASAGVPSSLLVSTVKAMPLVAVGQASAVAAVSGNVVALTSGVLQSLSLGKLKAAIAVLLVAVAAGGATGVMTYRTLASGQEEPRQVEQPKAVPREINHKAEQVNPETNRRVAQATSDKERLQGSWAAVYGIMNGNKKPTDDPKLRNWKVTFDGDRVTLPGGQAVPYTLNALKQPKELDIAMEDDEGIIQAIYEFEGDRLRIFWVKQEKRPPDFHTPRDKGLCIVLERRNGP